MTSVNSQLISGTHYKYLHKILIMLPSTASFPLGLGPLFQTKQSGALVPLDFFLYTKTKIHMPPYIFTRTIVHFTHNSLEGTLLHLRPRNNLRHSFFPKNKQICKAVTTIIKT